MHKSLQRGAQSGVVPAGPLQSSRCSFIHTTRRILSNPRSLLSQLLDHFFNCSEGLGSAGGGQRVGGKQCSAGPWEAEQLREHLQTHTHVVSCWESLATLVLILMYRLEHWSEPYLCGQSLDAKSSCRLHSFVFCRASLCVTCICIFFVYLFFVTWK